MSTLLTKSIDYLSMMSVEVLNDSDKKIFHIKQVEEELQSTTTLMSHDFPNMLSMALSAFLRCVGDYEPNVYSVAEDCLNNLVRQMLNIYPEHVISSLYQGLRVEGRTQRVSLKLLGSVCHNLKPSKTKGFFHRLVERINQLLDNCTDTLLLETIGDEFENFAVKILSHFTQDDVQNLLEKFFIVSLIETSSVRRSATNAIVSICKYAPDSRSAFQNITDLLISKILDKEKTDNDAIGIFYCYFKLFELCMQQYNILDYRKNYMLPHVVTSIKSAFEYLSSSNNNVLASALELINYIIYSYSEILTTLWKDEICELISSNLNNIEILIFHSKDANVNVKKLSISCYSNILNFDFASTSVSLQKNWDLFEALFHHNDPLFKGQMILLRANYIIGYLKHYGNSTTVPDDVLNVGDLVNSIIESFTNESSAIITKHCIESISLIWEYLINSKYALFCFYILHIFIHFKTSNRLIIVELMNFISQVDFCVLNFLQEKTYDKNHIEMYYFQIKNDIHLFVKCRWQEKCFDFIVNFLQDLDKKICTAASLSFVKLFDHIDYEEYIQKVKDPFVLYESQNYIPPREKKYFSPHSDWLITRFIQNIMTKSDLGFIRGILQSLYYLSIKRHVEILPFLPYIFDYLESISMNIETHFFVLSIFSNISCSLTRDVEIYSKKIFVHFCRILRILTSIKLGQSIPTYKESKAGLENDIGSVSGQPLYLELWSKLNDAYRLANQGTIDQDNLYFKIQHIAWHGMASYLSSAHSARFINSHLHEIFDYVTISFDDEPVACVHCLRYMFIKYFSFKGKDDTFPTFFRSEIDLPESLLDPFLPKSRDPHRELYFLNTFDSLPPMNYRLDISQSTKEMLAVLNTGSKREILKQFEPFIKTSIYRYCSTQDDKFQHATLLLFLSLIKYEVNFEILDRDKAFFHSIKSQVVHRRPKVPMFSQIMLLTALHIEKKYLHEELTSDDLTIYLKEMMSGWNNFSDEYESSVLYLVHTLFSTCESSGENKYNDMRIQLLKSFIQKLPKFRATEIMIRIINILNTLEDKSYHFHYSSLIAEEFVNLILDKGWVLSKISYNDILSLCSLIDLLPYESFDPEIIMKNLRKVIVDVKKDGTEEGHCEEDLNIAFLYSVPNHQLSSILILLRILTKYDHVEPDDRTEMVSSLFEGLNIIINDVSHHKRDSMIQSFALDTFIMTLKQFPEKVILEFRVVLLAKWDPNDILIKSSKSYQSCVSFAIFRLFMYLKIYSINYSVLFDQNNSSWHAIYFNQFCFNSILVNIENDLDVVQYVPLMNLQNVIHISNLLQGDISLAYLFDKVKTDHSTNNWMSLLLSFKPSKEIIAFVFEHLSFNNDILVRLKLERYLLSNAQQFPQQIHDEVLSRRGELRSKFVMKITSSLESFKESLFMIKAQEFLSPKNNDVQTINLWINSILKYSVRFAWELFDYIPILLTAYNEISSTENVDQTIDILQTKIIQKKYTYKYLYFHCIIVFVNRDKNVIENINLSNILHSFNTDLLDIYDLYYGDGKISLFKMVSLLCFVQKIAEWNVVTVQENPIIFSIFRLYTIYYQISEDNNDDIIKVISFFADELVHFTKTKDKVKKQFLSLFNVLVSADYEYLLFPQEEHIINYDYYDKPDEILKNMAITLSFHPLTNESVSNIVWDHLYQVATESGQGDYDVATPVILKVLATRGLTQFLRRKNQIQMSKVLKLQGILELHLNNYLLQMDKVNLFLQQESILSLYTLTKNKLIELEALYALLNTYRTFTSPNYDHGSDPVTYPVLMQTYGNVIVEVGKNDYEGFEAAKESLLALSMNMLNSNSGSLIDICAGVMSIIKFKGHIPEHVIGKHPDVLRYLYRFLAEATTKAVKKEIIMDLKKEVIQDIVDPFVYLSKFKEHLLTLKKENNRELIEDILPMLLLENFPEEQIPSLILSENMKMETGIHLVEVLHIIITTSDIGGRLLPELPELINTYLSSLEQIIMKVSTEEIVANLTTLFLVSLDTPIAHHILKKQTQGYIPTNEEFILAAMIFYHALPETDTRSLFIKNISVPNVPPFTDIEQDLQYW